MGLEIKMIMPQDLNPQVIDDKEIASIRVELVKSQSTKAERITEKFFVAALGAIPWVGGFIAAAAELARNESNANADSLRTKWLEEHQRRLEALRDTLADIERRFDSFGKQVEERIQSPEYLSLVRQAFRAWDQAETEDKRRFVANVVSNAAGTRLVSDDVLRLFISWLSTYHEAHLAVIREIHQNPGSTRYDMWCGVYGEGEPPREDSAEADLYRMLIRDLSTGGVIRQARGTNEAGQFLRKRPPLHRHTTPNTMKSAFDDAEQYVLTELGKQFVHYTLMGEVRRLEESDG